MTKAPVWVWIKPGPNTPHIPMPGRKPLKAEGERVEKTIFVRRLIQDKDVIEFDPDAPAPAADGASKAATQTSAPAAPAATATPPSSGKEATS